MFVFKEKPLREGHVNVTVRVRIIMLSIISECQIQGASSGLGLWAWVERCRLWGSRFSRKGQAFVLSAADHIQPPELWAFIRGNNVGFIICKNGGSKRGLSCSESCTTGRGHLSALIESLGCSAGGNVQPRTHIRIHTDMWLLEAFQCPLWKQGLQGYLFIETLGLFF